MTALFAVATARQALVIGFAKVCNDFTSLVANTTGNALSTRAAPTGLLAIFIVGAGLADRVLRDRIGDRVGRIRK